MTEVAPAQVQVRSRVAVRLQPWPDISLTGHLVSFRNLGEAAEHLTFVMPSRRKVPLVRLHSECLTGDVLGSTRCDCGPQLVESMRLLAGEGGVLLYLRQEGRGIGLYNKLDAYVLQDGGMDTFSANRHLGRGEDERDYRAAAAMLTALGITRIRLLSNNADKGRQLRAAGIAVTEMRNTKVYVTPHNRRYLAAKAELAGHQIVLGPTQ